MKHKPIHLGIIHTSLGELQWLVPYFFLLSRKETQARFVLVFFSQTVYQKAKDEQTHLSTFSSFGEVLPKKALFSFLLKNRRRIKSIYKDFWPIHRRSLASAIRFCSPGARLYLYPHANALYSVKGMLSEEEEIEQKHDPSCFDFILLNTEHDTQYWGKRVDPARFIITGSPAYTAEWLNVLRQARPKEMTDLKDRSKDRKVVAVFTRPADNEFLDPDDYRYLIKGIIEESSKLKDFFLVFKPHPREDKDYLEQEITRQGLTDYEISNLNPFLLSSISHLSINFWSSTITDSLSMDCPTIEFYKYHSRGNDKWLRNSDAGWSSFYSHLNLCEAETDQGSFGMKLSAMYHDTSGFLKQQKSSFNTVFLKGEISTDAFQQRIEQTKLKGDLKDWLQVIISSIKG